MQAECREDGSAVKPCVTSVFLLALHCALPICLLGTKAELQLAQCVNLLFGTDAGIYYEFTLATWYKIFHVLAIGFVK